MNGDTGRDMEEAVYRSKRCRAPGGSGLRLFCGIETDFERLAECVGQTRGVQTSDDISLLFLLEDGQSQIPVNCSEKTAKRKGKEAQYI